MVDADKRMSTSGTGLGKAEALGFLAHVNAERLHSLQATEDTFRAMDLNCNGKISLIEFFLYVPRCGCCCCSFAHLCRPSGSRFR